MMTVEIAKVAAVILATTGVLVPGPGYQKQDEPLKLRADLVTVFASVTDRRGHPIRELGAGDFTVYEDGVKQKVAQFSPTEGPFTVMLLLDISGSTKSELTLIKRAARRFLAELRPDDRIAVIAFASSVELVSEFGDPRSRVESAIERIGRGNSPDEERFTPNTGTSFYDALYLAVEEPAFQRAEGRKAIVCMSDGVDSTSKLGYGEIAKQVEQSAAAVYFLELNTEEVTLAGLLKPRTDPGYVNFSQSQLNRYFDEFEPDSIDRHRHRDFLPVETRKRINEALYNVARREMRALSERAGGRVYPVTTLDGLEDVFTQVAAELRAQYVLAYYPANQAHDGRWRRIRVEVKRPDATVRARSGYWAPSK